MNQLGAVFVPVSDIRRSAEWYGRLLGLAAEAPSHEDRIVTLPLQEGVSLILDAHRPPVAGMPRQTLFFLWADDLAAAEGHLREMGVVPTGEPQDIGSVSFLTFEDPDGNPLMICRRNG